MEKISLVSFSSFALRCIYKEIKAFTHLSDKNIQSKKQRSHLRLRRHVNLRSVNLRQLMRVYQKRRPLLIELRRTRYLVSSSSITLLCIYKEIKAFTHLCNENIQTKKDNCLLNLALSPSTSSCNKAKAFDSIKIGHSERYKDQRDICQVSLNNKS